jgi:hypothetical protein
VLIEISKMQIHAAILRSKVVVNMMPFHAVFFLMSLAQKLREILPIWIHFYEISK